MKLKVVLLALLAFVSSSVFAQQDPNAEKLLNEMSAKFKAMKSFQANFSVSIQSAKGVVKESKSGNILVKGAKYVMKVAGYEIYNDGTTVWTYMKDENECNITTNEPDGDAISPTNITTMYKKGYKYRLLADEVENKITYAVVELVPNDKNKSFFKIKLKINKTTKEIKSWTVFEKSSTRSVYSITKLSQNVPADDKLFKFDKTKYKGCNVVDLR